MVSEVSWGFVWPSLLLEKTRVGISNSTLNFNNDFFFYKNSYSIVKRCVVKWQIHEFDWEPKFLQKNNVWIVLHFSEGGVAWINVRIEQLNSNLKPTVGGSLFNRLLCTYLWIYTHNCVVACVVGNLSYIYFTLAEDNNNNNNVNAITHKKSVQNQAHTHDIWHSGQHHQYFFGGAFFLFFLDSIQEGGGEREKGWYAAKSHKSDSNPGCCKGLSPHALGEPEVAPAFFYRASSTCTATDNSVIFLTNQ